MDSDCYALVNTVNTVGVMGKGIALQFKNEFPYNYEVYRKACLSQQLNIGGLLLVRDASMLMGERLIINFPTKTYWRQPAEYIYIEKGLLSLVDLITMEQIKSIALPALGCGNGGLLWARVRHLIIRHLESLDAIIEVYEP